MLGALGKREGEVGIEALAPGERSIVRRQALGVTVGATIVAVILTAIGCVIPCL